MAALDNRIVEAINIAADYPVIDRVGIFGSYARGEQTANSDIDILYGYSHDIKDENWVLGLLEFIEEAENALKSKFGDDIKTDFVSLDGLMESNNAEIRNNILNGVKWIYSKNQPI
jgi:predicted nucleotidyltransferase